MKSTPYGSQWHGALARLPRPTKILLVVTLAMLLLATLPALGLVPLPGGEPLHRATASSDFDSRSWDEVFYQDFNRPAALGQFLAVYGNSFTVYPYPWTDSSRSNRSDPGYYYADKTLSAQAGSLDVWLHYDQELGQYLVAAAVPKLPTMRYGRFALRLRSDQIPGYKIAPLLWPDSENFPDDGEIDMPEGPLNGRNFVANSHFAQPTGTSRRFQDTFSTGVNGQEWHVYETVWSPGRAEFFVDGESIGVSTNAVPSNPMHWVLQFETVIGSISPPKTSQGHVQIDWVKVWKWTG